VDIVREATSSGGHTKSAMYCARIDSRTHSEPKSHFPEPANLQQRSTSSRTFAQRLPLLEPRWAFFSSLESFRLSAPLSFGFLGEPSSLVLPSCLRFCAKRLVPSSVEASSTWGCKLSAVEMRNLSRLKQTKASFNKLRVLGLDWSSTRRI
jgi:hypothetical protein